MGKRWNSGPTKRQQAAKRWAGNVERAVRADRIHMRGLSHQTLVVPRGLKGTTLGPASPGRHLSREEIAKVEAELRARGDL